MRLGPCDGCIEGDRDGLPVGKVVGRLDRADVGSFVGS